MRRAIFIFLVALAGCSSPTPPTSNNAPNGRDLKANYGADLDKEYATHILGALEHFDIAAKDAESVDEASWNEYSQKGKFSPVLMKHLNEGLALENGWIKVMKGLHPPEQFQAFHDQAIKNTQTKIDNLADLILAMEKNSKTEILRVLDKGVVTGKLNKQEMDKILQGKTAEQYLGLK